MPDSFLSFNNVSYILPNGDALFSGISFDISRGEKAALTGPNGIGKTTLFRLAQKVLLPADGSIVCNAIPAFLPQETELNQTVGNVLGVQPILEALEKLNAGNCNEHLFDLIGQRWNIRSEIEQALTDFGLDFVELSDSFDRLSGGEREKILLLKIFLADSPILMFDEPTNNLDSRTRNVFYDYIRTTAKTVFLISHDRDLLERMNCILELSENGLKKYGGNYHFYLTEKNKEKQCLQNQKSCLQNEAARLIKNRLKIENSAGKQARTAQRKINSKKFIKIQANAMHGIAQETKAKKIKKIKEKLTHKQEKLYEVKLSLREENVTIPLPAKPFLKDTVLEISDLSFDFGKRPLFRHFNLILKGGEKLHLQGNNGSGKTTLIRLILGDLQPTHGSVRLKGRAAYLSQDLSLLSAKKTVVENIMDLNPGISVNEACAAAAHFQFRGKDGLKTVKSLSGGEKLKAALAAVLGTDRCPDILILDEPTNNLDIQSTEILEKALNDYRGSLIIVSHDRIFVNAVKIDRSICLQSIVLK